MFLGFFLFFTHDEKVSKLHLCKKNCLLVLQCSTHQPERLVLEQLVQLLEEVYLAE
jgi:hypothetical protein